MKYYKSIFVINMKSHTKPSQNIQRFSAERGTETHPFLTCIAFQICEMVATSKMQNKKGKSTRRNEVEGKH